MNLSNVVPIRPEQIGADACANAAIASARELERLEGRVQELSNQLGAAAVVERARLARELHDGLGAHLTAARFALARIEDWLPVDAPPACGEALALASSALDAVCDASQQLVADLHPPQLDAGVGLVSSLSHWAAEFGRRTQLRISVVCAADLRVTQLTPHATMEIFRVAQEALNNVAKHAQASNVTVIVASDRRQLTLKVADDGCGIARGARAKAGRFGLSGMRERCESLGGSFKIVSAARSHPRAGATLTARFAWSALLDGHAPPATPRTAQRY